MDFISYHKKCPFLNREAFGTRLLLHCSLLKGLFDEIILLSFHFMVDSRSSSFHLQWGVQDPLIWRLQCGEAVEARWDYSRIASSECELDKIVSFVVSFQYILQKQFNNHSHFISLPAVSQKKIIWIGCYLISLTRTTKQMKTQLIDFHSWLLKYFPATFHQFWMQL